MWTCHNCENTNKNENHICDVCGAAYPDVKLIWRNKDGKDSSCGGKAILSWDAYYCRSAFAIYGGKSYYLTDKKTIELPILDSPTSGTVYFCSSGGYIKEDFVVGNIDPAIDYFDIVPKKDEYCFGEEVNIRWKIRNGTGLLQLEHDDLTISNTCGNCRYIVEEGGEITLTVLSKSFSKIYKTIDVKVKPLKIPTIKSKTIIDSEKVKIGKPVRVKMNIEDCDFIAVSETGLFGKEDVIRKDFDTKDTFTFSITPSKTTTILSIIAFPTGVSKFSSAALKSKYCAKTSITITATTPEPEIVSISHTDTFIEKGGKFSVRWKTKNVDKVAISLRSTSSFIRDSRGEIEFYGPNGEATLSNITCDDTIHIVFYSKYKDPIVRDIDIHCKRFLKLYKLYKDFHKTD